MSLSQLSDLHFLTTQNRTPVFFFFCLNLFRNLHFTFCYPLYSLLKACKLCSGDFLQNPAGLSAQRRHSSFVKWLISRKNKSLFAYGKRSQEKRIPSSPLPNYFSTPHKFILAQPLSNNLLPPTRPLPPHITPPHKKKWNHFHLFIL